jgi:hypothetical protein
VAACDDVELAPQKQNLIGERLNLNAWCSAAHHDHCYSSRDEASLARVRGPSRRRRPCASARFRARGERVAARFRGRLDAVVK